MKLKIILKKVLHYSIKIESNILSEIKHWLNQIRKLKKVQFLQEKNYKIYSK